MNFMDPAGTNAMNPDSGGGGLCWGTAVYVDGVYYGCTGGGGGMPGGGGGGGGFCGGNYFDPTPNPLCYVPAVIYPGPDDRPATPECDPGFVPDSMMVTNFEGYTFSGGDINYAARAVFGEASNNFAEQMAVASVIYNRVDNPDFRTKGQIEQTLTDVVTAPHQFNAVTRPGPNRRFRNSAPGAFQNLNSDECYWLESAINAMSGAARQGASVDYTRFAAASSTTRGVQIGQTRFW